MVVFQRVCTNKPKQQICYQIEEVQNERKEK